MSKRPITDFPPDVQQYIGELRRESGDNRHAAKTAAETAQAEASTKLQQLIDTMSQSLGLKPTPADKELTPEQRVEQLAGQLTESQQQHKQAQKEQKQTADTLKTKSVELAIWQAAHTHEADPHRLTDSRRFMDTVTGLDPAAADFTTQLSTAIETAVKADPALKVTGLIPAPQVPPVSSGGEFGGGPAGGGTADPQSVDDFRAQIKSSRGAGS
jgi:hypothetical protein